MIFDINIDTKDTFPCIIARKNEDDEDLGFEAQAEDTDEEEIMEV